MSPAEHISRALALLPHVVGSSVSVDAAAEACRAMLSAIGSPVVAITGHVPADQYTLVCEIRDALEAAGNVLRRDHAVWCHDAPARGAWREATLAVRYLLRSTEAVA